MTIDWSKEVETVEDPPRPVRVLATDCGGDYPIAVLLSREPRLFTKDGFEWLDADGLALRNVPPPEPTRHEGWVKLYAKDGQWPSVSSNIFSSEDDARESVSMREPLAICKVAWMSDGSPVPGEAAGEDAALARGLMQVEINRLNALLTEARTKAEALNRDLDSRIAECGSAWEKCDEWRAKAESLQAEEEQLREELVRRSAKADDAMAAVQKVKSVVDAAVAYAKADNTPQCHAAYVALHEAVRTHQQSPKKSAAEAVANVAAMMGPVKVCRTCKWGILPEGAEPCCNCSFPALWEPSHD